MASWSPSRRCRAKSCSANRDGVYRRGGAGPAVRAARASSPATRIKLGTATFELRAKLVTEPDAASDGFGFAPRLLVSLDGLARVGPGAARQPGRACLQGAARRAAERGATWTRSATGRTQQFPEAGWAIRTRINAAPSLSANIERFSQFLTLVGLTALVVGGVGVANAVRAYLDGKRGVIATFKSLGASGGFVFTVYLIQILIIAGIGIVHRAGARRADAVRGAAPHSPRSSRCRRRQASIPARWRWRRCSACW